MSEHRRLSLSDGPPPRRLKTIRADGRLIGHGQQLAAQRLAPLFARPVPAGRVTRQQLRADCLWAWKSARDDDRQRAT